MRLLSLTIGLLPSIFSISAAKTYPSLVLSPTDEYILPNKASERRKNSEKIELECSGTNTDFIQWKCNGKAVSSSKYQQMTHIQPNGQQLTSSKLSVSKDKVAEYFGPEDYWCVCVLKNSFGNEKSEKAFVRIAYIESKFGKPKPESGGVKLGEEAFLLDCRPPKGVPEPTVTWFKDGEEIFIDFKNYQITENGDLIVRDVDKYDAGNYTCRASNVAGYRETETVLVWVYANGGWSDWAGWSRCEPQDGICGLGLRDRSRECDNPAPVNGKNCRGSSHKREECVLPCSPLNKPENTKWNTQPTFTYGDNSQNDSFNLTMIACLAGAAGIALVIFIVIYIYLKSRNNFNYLKKTQSQKKAPFNANHDFDLIRTPSQVDARSSNRKDGTLERLLYRPEMMTPSHTATHTHATPAYKPAYNPVYKDEFGTRSSSGVSTDPDNVTGHASSMHPANNSRVQNTSGHVTSSDQPIYHFIDAPPSAAQNNHQQPLINKPPPQNYNYNSNYPTYAYPNPYQPR